MIGNRKESKYIQEYERKSLKELYKDKTQIDILLTHDSPLDFVTPGFGLKEINEFLNLKQPVIQFHAHTGGYYNRKIFSNNITEIYKIAELEWRRDYNLKDGSLVLLKWKDRNRNSIEVIKDKWFKEYNYYNWNEI